MESYQDNEGGSVEQDMFRTGYAATRQRKNKRKEEKSSYQKRINQKQIRAEYARRAQAERAAEQTLGAALTAESSLSGMGSTMDGPWGNLFGRLRGKETLKSAGRGGGKLFFLFVSLPIFIIFLFLGFLLINLVLDSTYSSSYLSLPINLDSAEMLFSEQEMELQERIDRIQEEFPGYDDYEYSLQAIGHNPFTLLNYLSAKYGMFTVEDVEEEVKSLFTRMYQLSITAAVEKETQTTYETGSDGEKVEKTEEIEVKVLRVKMDLTPLETLIMNSMNADQKSLYEEYQESKGNLQQFSSPVEYYWYLYVTSYYGYRKNPKTDQMEMHRGVDIAVPVGTEVFSGQDGTVVEVSSNDYYGQYVVITNAAGYTTKYAHLSEACVKPQDTVIRGQTIGKSGDSGTSIGGELHIECMVNETYYNPLLYFEAGLKTLYGEDATGTGGDMAAGGSEASGNLDPADADKYTKLIAEAEKYLGWPYVWGGKSPSTSFDCSGFVCWCYTHGAGYDLPRAKAQTIYNKCIKISASEARPGDLVFFTNTYKASYPVTHIGIYVGNNEMIHAGDPISYQKITGYYQSHFYGYGRLPGW